MRTLFTLLALLAFALPALATLPVPVVTYDHASATMTATFYDESVPLPPTGFARWQVRILDRGIWSDYYDVHPSRVVMVQTEPPLQPGGYWLVVNALDADGFVIDGTPMFDWSYLPSTDYRGVLPRIAVGYGWDTSVALTNHVASQPVEVYIDLYYEDGTFLKTVDGVIAPHGSLAFYFDVVIFDQIDYTGSAEIRSTAPLSFVYLAAGPNGLSYSFMGQLETK